MKKIIKDVTQICRLDDINKLVEDLFSLKDQCKIYTFTGDLGAGKTTLVKALLKRFGINEAVTSPTFGYVNIYHNDKGEVLYHFDIYRLAGLDEFLQLGFDELLYAKNNWIFIEWPEVIKPLLDHKICEIHLDYDIENVEQRIMNYKLIV